MVFTERYEKEKHTAVFSCGVTFSKKKIHALQMRKARGWERLRKPRLWLKPWITERTQTATQLNTK